jgi:2-polyprenyl-3-methyl-5-hydroxy-6-metoxy-1,4-benzoquinol methylase
MRRMDIDSADDSFDALTFHLARYKFIARLLKPGDSALEIGCGTGYGARFLAEHLAEVVACEADAQTLERARSRFSRENLTFRPDVPPGRRFDAVVCLEVIEHLTKPDGRQLLQDIAAALDPRGVAFISTPRRVPQPTPNRQRYHLHEYDFEEFRESLEGVFARALIFTQIDEIIATHHESKAWNFVACCWGA